jgi:hypothetical protein
MTVMATKMPDIERGRSGTIAFPRAFALAAAQPNFPESSIVCRAM